jgi:hypothetical protein
MRYTPALDQGSAARKVSLENYNRLQVGQSFEGQADHRTRRGAMKSSASAVACG